MALNGFYILEKDGVSAIDCFDLYFTASSLIEQPYVWVEKQNRKNLANSNLSTVLSILKYDYYNRKLLSIVAPIII